MARHILLTGAPGCGKTTVIRAIVEQLRRSRAPGSVRGFRTEEVREDRTRVGFRIETVGGAGGTLARAGLRSGHTVGRYGVDLSSFESVGVAEVEDALCDATEGRDLVLVVDEIGKMELFSARFRQAVERAFAEVPHVVATVMQRKHPFADALKARPDVRPITVTVRNRADLPAEVLRQLA